MIAHREAIHEGKRSNTINTYTEEDDVDDPPQNDIDENDYASTRVESKTDNPEFIANSLKDLDQEGYVDVSEKKIKKEIWSHFLVNEILGVAICKYCLRKFKLNKKNTNWNFGDGMLKHLKFHCKKRPKLIGKISHKKSLITIFGLRHKVFKNHQKIYIFHEKISTAFVFWFIFEI